MKILKLIVQLATLWAVIPNMHAQEWLANGLVAYYPFTGSANDASGNGNHLTPELAAGSTFDRFGKANAAYSSSGSTTLKSLQNLPIIGNQDRSISMWYAGSGQGAVGWGNRSSPGASFSFQVYPRTVNFWGHYVDIACNVTPLPTKEWRHIICVYQKSVGDFKFYVNGEAVTKTYNVYQVETLNTAPTPIELVCDSIAVDEVRIYNRALSSGEVAKLYAQESFCSPSTATAVATISGGYVTGATIFDKGCGYTTPPTIRIIGGGGTGATATALLTGGAVTSVIVTSAGSGYTTPPEILIESPPIEAKVNIAVSKVKVTQTVRINHNYILEVSSDLVAWSAAGPQFTADAESIVTEFDVSDGEKYFRLREVP